MNDKEIAEKLELAYGVFKREGASSRYMNINNHLIESEKQSVQTTLNLALHYLYIVIAYYIIKIKNINLTFTKTPKERK